MQGGMPMILFRSKRSLIKENRILERELKVTKARYLAGNVIQNRRKYTRDDGYYSKIEDVPDYKSKWMNSFYDLHPDIAELYSDGNLSPGRLLNIREWNRRDNYKKDTYNYIAFVVHCSAVISTAEGPVLYLEDPYGHIISKPLTWASLETAKSWANRMLIAHIGLNYIDKEYYPINRIQTLK